SKNPSIDKWVWLLKRTLYKNNWSHLHEGFISDESYLRKLADMMDFMKDEQLFNTYNDYDVDLLRFIIDELEGVPF
ncbi:MAG: hypothetical protein QMB54_06885, partial [Neofamilia sp.]